MSPKPSKAELKKLAASYLQGINASLQKINASSGPLGEMAQEEAQRIFETCARLSLSDTCEVLRGLAQLLSFLSARVEEVDAAVTVLTDDAYVPPEVRLKVLRTSPALLNCKGVHERLYYSLPEPLQDRLSKG